MGKIQDVAQEMFTALFFQDGYHLDFQKWYGMKTQICMLLDVSA